MNLSELLKEAGFKKELSTAGDKRILEGVYKATFVETSPKEDNGYGPSQYGAFKISEVLTGSESHSQYPEFKDYFSTSPDKIASKKKGLAKLMNGLFSVGVEADPDDLNSSLGTEVFITAYKQKTWKKEGEDFVEVEGAYKQGWTFMTEENALKEAKKKSKDTAPF